MFRSAFEGEACRFDIECVVGTCNNRACQSGVSRVQSPNFVCYVYIHILHVVCLLKQVFRFKIVFPDDINKLSLNKLSPLQYLEKWPGEQDNRRGGVNIDPDDEIRLYGTVRTSFGSSNIFPASKSTSIRFQLSELQKVDGLGICLYGDYGTSFQDNNVYCVVVRGGRISLENDNVIVARDDASLAGVNVNVALGKATRQSSIVQPGYSELAVDGNLNQIFDNEFWEGNSVTHTGTQISPWWEVDLTYPTVIRRIVIYKRNEDYEDDLSDFTLRIYRADGVEVDSRVFNGNAPSTQVFLFSDVIGTRVRITLNGDEERTLCLAEVQVFEPTFHFDIPIGEILNLPSDLKVNRIAFVQDHKEAENEASVIENMVIYDSDGGGVTVSSFHCECCSATICSILVLIALGFVPRHVTGLRYFLQMQII